MCDKMDVCEEAGRRYRDTCLLLCEKGEKREHMKKFYAWYQKHITGAIFTGLILGILTGLLLADRFTPILTVTGVIGGIYMNALNMMIFLRESIIYSFHKLREIWWIWFAQTLIM